MRTTLYLVRHAATPANLQKPAKLQGCRANPDLHPVPRRCNESFTAFSQPFATLRA